MPAHFRDAGVRKKEGQRLGAEWREAGRDRARRKSMGDHGNGSPGRRAGAIIRA